MRSLSHLYEQITAFQNSGCHDQAVQAAIFALDEYPDDARLWELLGIAYHGRREFHDATEALETATILGPLSPAGQIALAGCYLVSNRRELARTMYRFLASERGRVSSSLLPLLASGLSRLDEKDLALDVHRERVQRDPENDEAVYAVAHYLQLLHYPDELILPAAHQAYQLAPDRLRNRVMLALVHHRCGNDAEACRLVSVVEESELIGRTCPQRLQGLASLFEAVGDLRMQNACLLRIAELAERRKLRTKETPGNC